MERHDERAYELFLSGCNCAQAVLLAFAPDAGLTEQQALRVASSFGGGIGGMREVCGAVSGMLMAVGLLYGYAPGDRAGKSKHYARVRELSERYRAENGSIICRELLGLAGQTAGQQPSERTAEYYKKRPCPELCRMAASILDDYIAAHPIEK